MGRRVEKKSWRLAVLRVLLWARGLGFGGRLERACRGEVAFRPSARASCRGD